MNYSGYQIETVLRQLRRLRGILLARAGVTGRDRVSLSEEAHRRAPVVRLVEEEDIPVAGRTVREIVDERRYPPPVERELERRADSFLDGHEPPPSPIPKLRKHAT